MLLPLHQYSEDDIVFLKPYLELDIFNENGHLQMNY